MVSNRYLDPDQSENSDFNVNSDNNVNFNQNVTPNSNDLDSEEESPSVMSPSNIFEPLTTFVDVHEYDPEVRRSTRVRKEYRDPNYIYSNGVSRLTQYAMSAVSKDIKDKRKAEIMAETLLECVNVEPGEPGSDPTFFIPEPRNLHQIVKMPMRYRKPWLEAFVKELRGLIKKHTVKIGSPRPHDPVTPVMDIYKCKLDQNGMIDKLKCCMVFRGDLYEPTEPEDSWNPFASYLALRFYLATCAMYNIFPSQTDWVQAYLQCKMKEKVYVILPEFWKSFLPDDLAAYCGVPLELLRALYGYTYSGKRLYEEQEEFLKSQGFEQAPILGIWVKRLPNNGLFILLLFADDLLSACTDPVELANFKAAISARFEVSWKPVADWYLQARIQQDKHGNISIDQSRYSKSIIQRYLPNAPETPSQEDLNLYLNPLPRNFKFTKDDNSKTIEEVHQLEREYGYRFIEVIGSLNYLANTAIRELYGI
jgi:Reverse transcriptase (RNA-dependent DNA polymerase)